MADGYLNLPGGAGNYLDTADHADFDVLGDITIDVEAALVDWTPAVINSLFNHSNATGNIRAWLLRLNTNGTLNLIWSTNGTATVSVNSTVATGIADGTRYWVRATLDVDNGASQRVIKFYTSPDGVTWTQLGTTVTQAGVTSIFNTTALPAIGMQDAGASNPGIGKVYRARLYDGFDGAGTLKASPDFTANVGGSTYTDPQGHVWTVRGTATLVAATLNITAAGAGASGGSLAATVLRQATASGSGQSTGSLAALAQRQASATGSGVGGGQLAAVRRLAASMAGAGAGAGALATMVERQAAASGAGLSGGQLAALRLLAAGAMGAGVSGGGLYVLGDNNVAATGSGAGGGAMDAVLRRYIAAAGAGAGGGSLGANRLLALSASGAGLSSGQLTALRLVTAAAAGAGQSGGALAVLRLLMASASGAGIGAGSMAGAVAGVVTLSRSRVTSREPSNHASTRGPATRVTVSEP